ncbi:hypothetical protein IJ707_02565 [bacterium]|nr:hypothetical protein [bacterium]
MQTAQKTQFGELLAQKKDSLFYLNVQDRRMRFNNSQDPIYFAFDYLDNRPVSELAKEFVEDSVYEGKKFLSNIIN